MNVSLTKMSKGVFVRILFVIFFLFLMAGCGGNGKGSDKVFQQRHIVSGTVEAPSGLIAANENHNLLRRLASMIVQFANASVTGLLPVPDGTEVELIRLNNDGTKNTVLASTTTSKGKYTFDLTELGLGFSSDLAVSTMGQGLQMRAFVISDTVDINPISEAAVRLVFEQIASIPGSLIQHFTIKELHDFVASIDLITSAHDTAADVGIEYTVTAIKNLAILNNGIIKFLAAAAEEGQTNEGPGDITNLFPLAPGDIWNFFADSFDQNEKYFTAKTVTGIKLIDSITASVVTESNVDNTGSSEEEYLEKNSRGIINWGNNSPEDFLTSQLIPYKQVNFPLIIGASNEIINYSNLEWQDDLDTDGLNESFSMIATVTNLGKEAVALPIRDFPSTLRIEAKVDVIVTLSSDGTKVTLEHTITEWRAQDVGPVKITEIIQAQSLDVTVTDSITKKLAGFRVNGTGQGLLPKFTIADDLASAGSDSEEPGKPGIGTDGTNYLVVTCRDDSGDPPTGLIGVFVSDTGVLSAPFHIAQHSCSNCVASVAFDGTNYLVVFQRYSFSSGNQDIFGVRVAPTGDVLDNMDGFPISSGSESKFSPAVAFDGTNYLVIFGKFSSASASDIYGARICPSGQVLDEFPISLSDGDQAFPSIAFDGINYMVVWEDTREGSGPSLQTNVYGARITPSGTILDPSGIEIATAPGYQGDAQITFDGLNYFVVWRNVESFFQYPPVSEIYGRRIKIDGTLLDSSPETDGIAISNTALGKGDLAVAFNGTNHFVVWRMGTFSNDPPSGVYAARVNTAGVLLDGPADSDGLPVTGLPPGSSRYVHPTILFNGTNMLLALINNIELYGTRKSLEALYIYPF